MKLLSAQGDRDGGTYLARDEQKLNQPCIIKNLGPMLHGRLSAIDPPTPSHQQAKELLERETRIRQALGAHPQFPSLYAYFEENGWLYLVEELIEGQTLLTELQKFGNWGADQIRALLLDILPAVHLLHDAGVIHRDITPDRILRRYTPLWQGESQNLVNAVPSYLLPSQQGDNFSWFSPQSMANTASRIPPASNDSLFLPLTENGYQIFASPAPTLAPNAGISQPEAMGDWRQGCWEVEFALIDFGAPKLVVEQWYRGEDAASLGTEGYAAPEVWYERIAFASSDLFALGVTCFQLLSGVDPVSLFRAARGKPDGDRGYNWLKSWSQHLPQPLDPQLKRVLGKLLQPNLPDRYQSAIEVILDLQPQSPLQFPPEPEPVAEFTPEPEPVAEFAPEARSGVALVQEDGGRQEQTREEMGRQGEKISPHLSPSLPTPSYPPFQKYPVVKPHAVSSRGRPIGLWAVLLLLFGLVGFGVYKLWEMGFTIKAQRTQREGETSIPQSLVSPVPQSSGESPSPRATPSPLLPKPTPPPPPRPIIPPQNWTEATSFGDGKLGFDTIALGGKILISGDAEGKIRIWNWNSGRSAITLAGHSGRVWTLTISPDGKTLVSGGDDSTLKIWDSRTGVLKTTLKAHADWVSSALITPDGKYIISGGGDGTIRIWDLKTGGLQSSIKAHSDWVSSLSLSADGQTLASASFDKTIKVWSLSGARVLPQKTLLAHEDVVRMVAISPDGKILVSGSYDQTVKVWDLATGTVSHNLTGHAQGVMCVAISPDGKTLFTGGEDQMVRIWSLPSGELKGTLEGHKDTVMSLAVAKNGQNLVSASLDGTMLVRPLTALEISPVPD
ncbi:MAG TPA: protein kinase [Oscillatoriaceae cyanobacterium M33_DOE_052]|nr:protein kinase [Oscillatoriaceae cyanobacterium M33_DOE_052]